MKTPTLHLVHDATSVMDTYDLDPFITWMRSWGASDRTVSDRTAIVRAAIRDHWGDPLTVTEEGLSAWLATPGWSDWTRVAYIAHARSFFAWLHKSGRREDNPTEEMRSPRTPKDLPRPLDDREVGLLLGHLTGDRRAWFDLGRLAGLRAHEIAKLRGEDVSAETIYVVGMRSAR